MHRQKLPETDVDKDIATHFVHMNEGRALFVKDGDYFRSQGGVHEPWGQVWVPVMAKSVGDARRQAARLFGVELSHIYDGEE